MTEDQLIARYIEADPHRAGPADARLREHGVAVWALVGNLPSAHDDAAELATAYDVSREAVEAALAYYRRHREAIDARIAANAE